MPTLSKACFTSLSPIEPWCRCGALVYICAVYVCMLWLGYMCTVLHQASDDVQDVLPVLTTYMVDDQIMEKQCVVVA